MRRLKIFWRASLAALAIMALAGCPNQVLSEDPIAEPSIHTYQDARELAPSDTVFFGNVVVNASKDVVVTIENAGEGDLVLSGIPAVSISGPNSAFFSIISQPAGSIGPSQTGSFTARLTAPGTPGDLSATASFSCNDSDCPGWALVLQASVTAAPEPEMDLRAAVGGSLADGGSYPFGVTQVGAVTDSVFTIWNLGTADLVLDGAAKVLITGADADQFAVTAQPDSPVAAGESTSFTVRFQPTASGLKNATVSIENNDSDEDPYNLTFSGSAAAPEIDVRNISGATIPNGTGSYVFDDTVLGSPSAVAFYIHNTGTAPLDLTGSPRVQIAGPNADQFSILLIPASPVDAGSSSRLDVKFTPTSVGVKSATLSIANDDGDENPYTFGISGLGVGEAEMDVKNPSGVSIPDGTGVWSFAGTMLTTSTAATFTIGNTGSAALVLGGTPKVVIGGTDAAMFSVTAQPASSIAISGTTTFEVTFTPTSEGTKSANLSISNNDSNENPYNFAIGGSGTAWHGTKAIDMAGARGLSSAIAVSSGNVLVSYNDLYNGNLRFIKSMDGGATWSPSITVDATGVTGFGSDIAWIGSSIIIAYFDSTNDDLRVARSTDGGDTWSYQTVDSTGEVGRYCSLACYNTTVHIIYYDATNGNLKHAKSTDSGVTWSPANIRTIDNSANDVGKYADIAVNGNLLYASYYDSTGDDLKFAYSSNAGDTWSSKAIDTTGDVGQASSIGIYGSQILVSYFSATTEELKFIRSSNSGTTWNTPVIVDTNGRVGLDTCISVPTSGFGNTAYISYYDWTNDNLKLAATSDGGLTWPTVVTVDSTGAVGSNSAVVGVGSTVYVSYYFETLEFLKFAKSIDGGASW